MSVSRPSESVNQPLKFGQGNAKLDDAITTFSLPAGFTCPSADLCRGSSDRRTGRIREPRKGPTGFRCYASSMEARRPSVRRARWHNFALLKECRTTEETARLILDSLSPFARIVRVHDSGDFFKQDYFDAWLDVGRGRTETTFYFYTKSLGFWVQRMNEIGDGHSPGSIANVIPTASWGGREDELITEYGLRSARVVFSVAEAMDLGLDVDHDDSHALVHGPDFALLLHGTQPPGTAAARAVAVLRDGGFAGYGRSTRLPLKTIWMPPSKGESDAGDTRTHGAS